ncbi:hypothetical protein Tco_0490086 [Tanacetum coccineum]
MQEELLQFELQKVGDEAVHKELGDRMERAVTTASRLEAEQDNGSGPRCQVTILGLQMLKLGFHSHGSDEGSLTLNELTVLCTSLSKKVESLESALKQTKQTYGAAYTKLIMNVKKLENKVKSIKVRRKGRSDEDLMYVTGVYDYPEGFIGPNMDVTLAGALMDLLKSGKKKSPNPKVRGISFQDPEEVVRREVISPPVSNILAKDKGKAIITEPEKPLIKKDQIQSDEELALRLHAEEQDKFKRLQKERAAQEESKQ